MGAETWTKEEIVEEIRRLAKSFTPEWKLNIENPDAGTVIALIFAEQTAETIKCSQSAWNRYQTEFIGQFGISFRPPQPARAIAALRLFEDAPSGMEIKKGMKFLAEEEAKQEAVVFTACHDIYAANTRIASLWMISEERESYSRIREFPFRLFCPQEKEIHENALLLYHTFAMDCADEVFCLRVSGTYEADVFARELADTGKYQISYYGAEGFTPVEEVWTEGEFLCLKRSGSEEKQRIGQEDYSALRIDRTAPLKEDIAVETLEILPRGGQKRPDFIQGDDSQIDVERAEIFGREPALYQSCYLGQEEIFCKQDAKISCTFWVSFGESESFWETTKIQRKFPLIQKKQTEVYRPAAVDVWIQEIAVSYYNGIGWRMLPGSQDVKSIFANGEEGTYEFAFFCPKDWRPVSVGGYEQRCLRFQIVRADGCYMRPARYHYPILSKISFHYTYEPGRALTPQILRRRQGLSENDVTRELEEGGVRRAFQRFRLQGESLLLGLDKKPQKGPASFYFILESHLSSMGMKVIFEYSGSQGFQRLKTEDKTRGFSTSGLVLWMVPKDMQTAEIAGERYYWIRIRAADAMGEKRYFPVVKHIYLNGVELWNVEEADPQEFYLDKVGKHMSFPLKGRHILWAKVWVNEKDQLTLSQMIEMQKRCPQDVKAEYDLYGNVRAFYVRWQETENFDQSGAKDRHYQIDRAKNRIVFGDGIHGKIPRTLQDTAFTVQVFCGGGETGNVKSKAIHIPCVGGAFLEQVENPLPAFGGSGLESRAMLQKRAGAFFGNRGRLVTEQDFVQEALSFSESIGKAECIPGMRVNGQRDENCVLLVVLMKKYEEGSMAFFNIKEKLREHLISKSGITVDSGNIEVSEPVFVRVSLDLWMLETQMERRMEIQESIRQKIKRFLDPFCGQYGAGWQIGRLPRESQIRMLLNDIGTEIPILHDTATISYTDHQGFHQSSLEEAIEIPFGICINGEHHIYALTERERGQYAAKSKFWRKDV